MRWKICSPRDAFATGFVDFVAAQAKVGGCSGVGFINTTFPAFLRNLAPLLSRSVEKYCHRQDFWAGHTPDRQGPGGIRPVFVSLQLLCCVET
jgi:hypothetical protein